MRETGKEEKCANKGVSCWPATTDQYLAFCILFPPLFSLPSDRKQLVCAKGAQMRRLNKALDAHSKALLLILQVSAEPLWPVTCPERCCFARLWVDLAQGIMHEFWHMCSRFSSVDEDDHQSPYRLRKMPHNSYVWWTDKNWIYYCLKIFSNLIHYTQINNMTSLASMMICLFSYALFILTNLN